MQYLPYEKGNHVPLVRALSLPFSLSLQFPPHKAVPAVRPPTFRGFARPLKRANFNTHTHIHQIARANVCCFTCASPRDFVCFIYRIFHLPALTMRAHTAREWGLCMAESWGRGRRRKKKGQLPCLRARQLVSQLRAFKVALITQPQPRKKANFQGVYMNVRIVNMAALKLNRRYSGFAWYQV